MGRIGVSARGLQQRKIVFHLVVGRERTRDMVGGQQIRPPSSDTICRFVVMGSLAIARLRSSPPEFTSGLHLSKTHAEHPSCYTLSRAERDRSKRCYVSVARSRR